MRARLADQRSQRDDAAPTRERRIPPEESTTTGLGEYIRNESEDGRLGHALVMVAGLIVGELVRPHMDVGTALTLTPELSEIADDAMATLGAPVPWGIEDLDFTGLLAHIGARTRPSDPRSAVLPAIRDKSLDEDWLHVAAAAAALHGLWSRCATEQSMRAASNRATERLASSRVPEAPLRFPLEAAREHAREVAFDVALTALDLVLEPVVENHQERKFVLLDSLLEGASSGLIGAWVLRHGAAAGDT